MAQIDETLEIRLKTLEEKQTAQSLVIADLTKTTSEVLSAQKVQSVVLDQHTQQNLALLRDQRTVISMVSAIEAVIKTGGMLTALIKWIAGIAVALVTLYAAFKAAQSGDFTSLFRK